MNASICIAVLMSAAGASNAIACDTCGRCTPTPVVAVEEDDSSRIAGMLAGTVKPRLSEPSIDDEEWSGCTGGIVAGIVPRNPFHGLVPRLQVSWNELRENRIRHFRFQREAIVWTEAWATRSGLR